MKHVVCVVIGLCVILLMYGTLHNWTYDVVDEYSYPSGPNCISNVKNKTKIAILNPATTRNMDAPDLKSLSLMEITLPSISVAMETKYQYAVYIAIDEDDYMVNAQDMILFCESHCCQGWYFYRRNK